MATNPGLKDIKFHLKVASNTDSVSISNLLKIIDNSFIRAMLMSL